MGKHKISARPGCYGSFALNAYEHVHQVGIDYLELDIPEDPSFLKELMQDEETKFKVSSFCFEINTDDAKITEKFTAACEKAKNFDYFYFFSSTKAKTTFGFKREKGYKILHKLGDIAESYGKFISMETHPPYCLNADEMLRTMKGVDHKCVRINFDTANIYYYNQLKPGEGINQMEKVADYIGSLHLKESNGIPKAWFFPALGSPGGIVDFAKVFEIMDKHKFDGIYTLELEGVKGEPALTLETAKKRVVDSVEYLKKINVM
jgi:sugar phosphate isomerase/epimerase